MTLLPARRRGEGRGGEPGLMAASQIPKEVHTISLMVSVEWPRAS